MGAKALVKNGYLVPGTEIKKNVFHSLEVANLKAVHAIVVHQTDSATAESTLASYKHSRNGAHFLIDLDGTTYQTALLSKKTQHVGKFKSRCYETKACTKEELNTVRGIYEKTTDKKTGKLLGWHKRDELLRKHELSKPYPDRYPTNSDSIGIELVAKFDKTTNRWPEPTPEQVKALKDLVDQLSAAFGLTIEDVYAHGAIAHKDRTGMEGAAPLKALKAGGGRFAN